MSINIIKLNKTFFSVQHTDQELRNNQLIDVIFSDDLMTETELYNYFRSMDFNCFDLWDALTELDNDILLSGALFSNRGNLIYPF